MWGAVVMTGRSSSSSNFTTSPSLTPVIGAGAAAAACGCGTGAGRFICGTGGGPGVGERGGGRAGGRGGGGGDLRLRVGRRSLHHPEAAHADRCDDNGCRRDERHPAFLPGCDWNRRRDVHLMLEVRRDVDL